MGNGVSGVLWRAVVVATNAELRGLTDRELLRRFADANDQAAFAALVARHSALVFGVCRRALRTPQDAEDACQATFLTLARKARSIRSASDGPADRSARWARARAAST